jgi:predicted regulator of Ras-like GTPase activity (Roadblock/LC7/MglB family)
MARAKQTKSTDKLKNAIGYLTEYSGVKGAVIADSEGLVLASGGSNGFEPERYAAYSVEIVNALKGPLKGVLSPEIERLSVKTPSDWLTIVVLQNFMLVVAAGRQADDLLQIRISRSLEMITSNLSEKYSSFRKAEKPKTKNAISLEAIHV